MMQLKTFTALAGVATLAMAASSANAVTFVGYQTALNPDETLVTDFEGGPTLADLVLGLAGFSLTGTGELFTGSEAMVSAAPAFSATTRDETQYLSLQKDESAFLDTPEISAISFYIGSLDGWNRFTFHLADGTTQVVTGAVLAALPGMSANGSQTGFTSNGRLRFSFESAITGVEFFSGNNALEISDIAAVGPFALVPEPATWAMMLLGFGGVGMLMRRRVMSFA